MRKLITKQVERAIFLIAAVFILLWGFLQGLNVKAVTIDLLYLIIEVTILNAVSSSLFFTAFTVVFGGWLLRDVYFWKDDPRETDAGTVAAIIPVYKDAAVLANSVESLNASNYEDVEIYVICEDDDEASQEAAKALDCEMVLNQHPGSKAGAINTGFEEADADYYAIFDADETISPEFLPIGIGYLTEGYEAFRGRRVPEPSGLVEAFGYCERALSNIANTFMAVTRFKNVTSSSIIMKRNLWERANGYDDMLTEDIDFRHKAFRVGVTAKQHAQCSNMMEAPHTWRDFWNQRKRWMIGMVQIVHKAIVGGYDHNRSIRGVVSAVRAIITVVAMISLLFLVPKFFILLLLDMEAVFLLPFISLIAVVSLLSWHDHKTHNIRFLGWHVLLTVLALPVVSLIALKAVFEYVLTWEGEWYHVQKTPD